MHPSVLCLITKMEIQYGVRLSYIQSQRWKFNMASIILYVWSPKMELQKYGIHWFIFTKMKLWKSIDQRSYNVLSFCSSVHKDEDENLLKHSSLKHKRLDKDRNMKWKCIFHHRRQIIFLVFNTKNWRFAFII